MYKYLHKKCCEEKTIREAWKKLRKGKTKRRDVQWIEANMDESVKKMQIMLENTRPCEVERPELAFNPPKHRPKKIYEHGKERTIYCPSIWEQWVHHIVIQVLAPIVERVAYKYSCGSMPKRGAHYGKRQMERLVRKGFRNFLKVDVRHFFDNVRLETAIRILEKIIQDEWFIHLIRVIFQQFKKGLPLGFYPSQWLANFVLHELDEEVVKQEPGGFVRYVDDMVVTDNSKKKLRKILAVIRIELGKLRLKLKRNYQICKFVYQRKDGKMIGRYIDYMGFVFVRYTTILRKKIMVRAARCASRISKCKKISIRQAQSMLARCGWFKCTDTREAWNKYIKEKISVKQLKRVISWHDRRRKREHENRMDGRAYSREAGAVPAVVT